MPKVKKILVTGGTGFVGRPVLEDLAREDNEIFVVSRNNHQLDFENVRYLRADLTDANSLKAIKDELEGCEILVDMAASIPQENGEKRDFMDYLKTNFLGHVDLLNFCSNLKKILFLSTIDVYGPLVWKAYTEDHPTQPQSYYGLSKLMMENFLSVYCSERNLDLVILRLSQVYGPKDNLIKVIPIFADGIMNDKEITILGSGEDERTYVHIDDVVKAIKLGLEVNKSGIFNVAGEERVNVKQLVTLMEKLIGKRARIRRIKSDNCKLNSMAMDITKAQNELGFTPTVSIFEGLSSVIGNYL